MADHTHIEWTDATWNPVTGCSVVSPGCTNCYAMRLAGTRLKDHPSRQGLTRDTKSGPVWTGEVRFNEGWLDQPLRWKKPRRIFVCAHGDLFHESVPDAWIDQVFAVMALAPHHTFQVLTKRAARMRAYMSDPRTIGRIYNLVCDRVILEAHDVVLIAPGVSELTAPPGTRVYLDRWPLPNVWLGVSAEDEPRADERIPELLATPAAVRWVSLEPMVGPADLTPALFIFTHEDQAILDAAGDSDDLPILPFRDPATTPAAEVCTPRLDWVVLGGESGPGARPMHPDWARQVRDACAAAGVPFFFKQWGAWAEQIDLGHMDIQEDERLPDGRLVLVGPAPERRAACMANVGKAAAGRLLDGVTHDAMPGASR